MDRVCFIDRSGGVLDSSARSTDVLGRDGKKGSREILRGFNKGISVFVSSRGCGEIRIHFVDRKLRKALQ